jgi:hypothetical protein
MNAIMGFSDLLQDSNLDNKERIEYLKIIKIVETVWCLLLKTLEMSKIDASKLCLIIKD